MSQQTILVIDDNDQFVALACAILERAGFRSLEALDAKLGLDLAISQHPDLILVDNIMPGLTGFQVAQRLRTNPLTSAIPIIMVSGYAPRDIKENLANYGLDDYIAQPYLAAEFIACVRAVLARHTPPDTPRGQLDLFDDDSPKQGRLL